MRPIAAALLTALLLAANPDVVAAQSDRISNGVFFTKSLVSAPRAESIFGRVIPSAAKPVLVQSPPLVDAPPSPATDQPIDCAMVKAVDPNFHSNMPVIKPDPNVHYAMPVMKPSSCKASVQVAPTPAPGK
jgi:hypothetical protein